MGSPTVIAHIASPSPNSQVAARLVDINEDGQERLIDRGLYRPMTTDEDTRQVFQLHPAGWPVKAGHIVKLELLPADSPYGRVSNGEGPVDITNLELRLPVMERSAGGPVQKPAPKVVPPGYALADDYAGGKKAIPCQVDVGPKVGPKGSCADFTQRMGTGKKDSLRGTQGSDNIVGRRGKDRINARGGDDCANGNQGRDRINGNGGDDKLRGGAGNDVISAGPGRDIVDCGQGRHDRARVDRSDSVTGCESIRRKHHA
jgi:hypothetical protein